VPFGDTPYVYKNWRWRRNAHENASLVKHFGFAPAGQCQASIRGEFDNVFNRHYVNGADTVIGDSTFGQVTGGSGGCIGQLAARIES